ncbi:MAG: hypothetical protein IPH79_02150 [Sphingomonadales bacterium]|nr:hypothetical protein [Sphingomonadales bacterium]
MSTDHLILVLTALGATIWFAGAIKFLRQGHIDIYFEKRTRSEHPRTFWLYVFGALAAAIMAILVFIDVAIRIS